MHKHNYKPWANIYGDLVDQFNGDRTVYLCTECGKRKYKKEYVEAPLNYNAVMNYWMMHRIDIMSADSYLKEHLNSVIKDKESYMINFCQNRSNEVESI